MKASITTLAALLTLAAACPPCSVLASAPAALTSLQAQGKAVYDKTCIYCHAPGVWGSNRLARRMDKERAVLESRSDLTAGVIRAVVRMGIGSMPPYRRTEVSDADVAAIAAYLTRQSH